MRESLPKVEVRLTEEEYKASVTTVSPDERSEGNCPICLDSLESTDDGPAVRLPCGHQMHAACAHNLLVTQGVKPDCPVCRCSVRPSRREYDGSGGVRPIARYRRGGCLL